MRKFFITLALASIAATAAPAAAQGREQYRNDNSRYGDDRYEYQQDREQIGQRLNQLRQRIARVTQRGAVSQQEGARLRQDLALIERRYDRYARGGINRDEQRDLQNRIQNLQAQIREDRQDGRRQTLERGYQENGRYYDDRRDRDDD